jgi:hypothetical protein
MKVRVNFTVEFDADQYREQFDIPGEESSTSADIRNVLQNMALAAVVYALGDNDVNVTDAVHNN